MTIQESIGRAAFVIWFCKLKETSKSISEVEWKNRTVGDKRLWIKIAEAAVKENSRR